MNKLLLVFLILQNSALLAQELPKDEISLLQNIWGKQKQELVADYMKLSDAEAPGFWKVFEAYEDDRKKLASKRIDLISQYVNGYATMDNQLADKLATKRLSNDLAYNKLSQKYYKLFKKATSPVRAAQFFQLENYIQTSVSSYLQDNIPFIGELELSKKTK